VILADAFWTSATFGVILGGLLTTGGALLLDFRRTRREEQAEKRAVARDVRLAARLVVEELAESLALIEEAADTRRYWAGSRQLPTETWNGYRTEIAAAIESNLDWRQITEGYDAINNLNWLVNHRRQTDNDIDGHRLGFRVLPGDRTRAAWQEVRQAILVLEFRQDVPDVASRLRESEEHGVRRLWPFGDGEDFDYDAAEDVAIEEARQAEIRRAEEGFS
jgi:hypothetical protein